MQQRHGLFPRIIGKGDNAKRLADLLIRMRSEVAAGEDSSDGSTFFGLMSSASIDSLILIDREVDFPTVLLTQLTYEGLIDEVFGVQSNQAEVDTSVAGAPPGQPSQASSSASPSPSQSLKRKIQLDGADALYSTLRDANCAVVGPLLNKVARRLQQTYENRHAASKSTSELRDFVAKLPGYQAEQASLKLHTSLAEEILKQTRSEIFARALEVQQNIAGGADPTTQHDSIDELMSRDVPLPTVLRLLCLESCVFNGLRPRDLETFRRAILHAYGYQHLLTLSSLERMGLLQPRPGGGIVGVPIGRSGSVTTTNYSAVRKSLYLINDEVNESDPDDVAYVFSGYAPLSVRLVQCILQKQRLASFLGKAASGTVAPAAGIASTAAQGWKPFEDSVKQVRGATFDEVQAGEERAARARQILSGGGVGDGGKTVVVFFLGGICRAEVAALRFVARQLKEEGPGRKLLMCTTGVITGDSMVSAAIEGRSWGGGAATAA